MQVYFIKKHRPGNPISGQYMGTRGWHNGLLGPVSREKAVRVSSVIGGNIVAVEVRGLDEIPLDDITDELVLRVVRVEEETPEETAEEETPEEEDRDEETLEETLEAIDEDFPGYAVLKREGYDTFDALLEVDDLEEIHGIGPGMAAQIQERLEQ